LDWFGLAVGQAVELAGPTGDPAIALGLPTHGLKLGHGGAEFCKHHHRVSPVGRMVFLGASAGVSVLRRVPATPSIYLVYYFTTTPKLHDSEDFQSTHCFYLKEKFQAVSGEVRYRAHAVGSCARNGRDSGKIARCFEG
jgi:hypothetical protein